MHRWWYGVPACPLGRRTARRLQVEPRGRGQLTRTGRRTQTLKAKTKKKKQEKSQDLFCCSQTLPVFRSFGTCGVGSVRGILSLSGTHCRLHGIKVGLLLELADVFLVSNSLVAEPVGDLAGEKTRAECFCAAKANLEATGQASAADSNVGKCSGCVMNSCF